MLAFKILHLCNNDIAPMLSDPYRNLAEILEGTLSLMNYYARRMGDAPPTLEPAKAALQRAIAELYARAEREQAAD